MQNKPKGPILITAGGTGGHVYPGLAVARALQEQNIPVIWMGTDKGLEARVIPEAGIEMVYLSVHGLRGKGITDLLAAPFQLMKALFQSLHIMLKVKPSAVLGMGGFVAGPGGLVAALLGKPVIIHEQNAIPGLTNKLLSKVSKKILEGFPGTFAKNNSVGIGNPVRQDIAAIPAPMVRMGDRWGKVNVLVFGGSLGAQVLNEVVPMALDELPVDKRPVVRHQAGKGKDQATKSLYEKMNVTAEVTPFIEDMAEAYAWADLVICRSGALTVAELAAAGVASIMVPYLYAVDDHQTANAKYLSEAGAGVLIPQNDLTKEFLSTLLTELCGDRNKLIEMGVKARNLAKPEATKEVAAICAEYAGYDFDKGNGNSAETSEENRQTTISDSIKLSEDDGWDTFVETIGQEKLIEKGDGRLHESSLTKANSNKGINYETA
ncbi:MAG: undecaprenyldiphospho-muramoylpentapeptide beta-N-acetylglucosaminyltransferase [Thiotrichales bacterium]|nr:MAG: undecaprenyldiphospho-muramoylpentapeptide beta-N-acetylglucosaminyltransferase [Thiotrichales bacterium]